MAALTGEHADVGELVAWLGPCRTPSQPVSELHWSKPAFPVSRCGILLLVPTRWTRQVWPWVLLAHAGVVALLTGLFVVLVAAGSPDDGANIGAGLAALPLIPLGLPWSVPAAVDPYRLDRLPDVLRLGVMIGPAWLNVGLHGAVFARSRRRGADPAS